MSVEEEACFRALCSAVYYNKRCLLIYLCASAAVPLRLPHRRCRLAALAAGDALNSGLRACGPQKQPAGVHHAAPLDIRRRVAGRCAQPTVER